METVSIRPSKMKVLSQPQVFTAPYTACLYQWKILLCVVSWKNGNNCCHGNHFCFQALMHTSLCLFLTSKHQGKFMAHCHNSFIKVQYHSCKFLKILAKIAMATFSLATLFNLQKAITTIILFHTSLSKLVCMLVLI